jgi:hypothetical protein
MSGFTFERSLLISSSSPNKPRYDENGMAHSHNKENVKQHIVHFDNKHKSIMADDYEGVPPGNYVCNRCGTKGMCYLPFEYLQLLDSGLCSGLEL